MLEGRVVSASENEVKIQLRFGLQCLDRDEVEAIERGVTATPRRKATPDVTAVIDSRTTISAQPRLQSRHAERRRQPLRRSAISKGHRRHQANREATSPRPMPTEIEKINRQRLDLGFARAVTSRHYILFSNAPTQATLSYGKLLDGAYRKLSEIFSHDQDSEERLSVLIYSNPQEFVRKTGKPANLGGYFDGQYVLFFHSTRDAISARTVLLHEAAHQFQGRVLRRRGFDRSQPWLAEGLAVYLEPSQLIPTRQRHGGSKSRIQTGLLPRARYYEVAQLKQDIRTNSHVPLTHLLNTPQEAFTRLHHSYAWSLIHFLIHDNDGINRKHLVRLLQAVTDGESIEATLESIFNVDLDTIEAHWKRYVLKLAI